MFFANGLVGQIKELADPADLADCNLTATYSSQLAVSTNEQTNKTTTNKSNNPFSLLHLLFTIRWIHIFERIAFAYACPRLAPQLQLWFLSTCIIFLNGRMQTPDNIPPVWEDKTLFHFCETNRSATELTVQLNLYILLFQFGWVRFMWISLCVYSVGVLN